MEKDLQQQLEKRFAELPPDIQAAVESVDLSEKIRAMGTAHGLHVDQIGALEDEVMLVMLGFSDPNEFSANLASQVHISAEEAAKVADEVTQQLFLPIRDSMQAFLEARTEAQEPSSVSTSPAALSTPPAVPLPPPTKPVPLAPADVMLTQKTVSPPLSMAPQTAGETPIPQKPAYKADPYREPVE